MSVGGDKRSTGDMVDSIGDKRGTAASVGTAAVSGVVTGDSILAEVGDLCPARELLFQGFGVLPIILFG